MCIRDRIDRLESVLFVGMSDVVNRMQGNFGADRDHYMKSLMRPDLLILDDLGAERNTSFGKERVFEDVYKRQIWNSAVSSAFSMGLSGLPSTFANSARLLFS